MKKIAHRSGPVDYPEQTVQAAKQAVALGADLVEIDIRTSKDGVPVVSHDADAERVFGNTKKIRDMTAAEYTLLTHPDAPEFHAHTFRDYLTADIRPLLLHIKEIETVPAVVRMLNEYGYDDSAVVFGVASTEALQTVRSLRPQAQVLAFMRDPDCISDFIAHDVTYLRLWEGWLPVDGYDYTVPTWIMTDSLGVGYTTEEKLRALMRLPVDGILLNDIRMMKEENIQ